MISRLLLIILSCYQIVNFKQNYFLIKYNGFVLKVVNILDLFGKRFKKLRVDFGYTQEQLGKLLNVTKVSICNYEKGNRTPSIDTLIDISNLFKVDLDYLVGTDSYVVSENEESYGIRMATEEINLIKELRKHKDLYNSLIDDSRRTIELIEKKIR